MTGAGDEALTRLAEDLRRPEAYDFPVERVEFIQTHISLIFLAGDRVYKVKKPYDLGFLDYSTLENRRHLCSEEVRLNRRLAPQIYLRVSPVTLGPDGRARFFGDGEPVDYAVEMARVPEERRMDRLVEAGAVREEDLQPLVRILADFHARGRTGPGVDEHGTRDSVQRQFEELLARAERFVRPPEVGADDLWTLSETVLDALRTWGADFLGRHADVFDARVAAGRVRDGHGDLHCENVFLVDHDPIVFDCIEFSDEIRCGDVAAEMAFLAMDLEYRGAPELAAALLEDYTEVSGDEGLLAVLPFYKVRFAAVRGMVASLRSAETERPEEERRRAALSARRRFQLAAGYTLPPCLVLTCGLPGSGKSVLSSRLGPALRATVLQSDRIRKEICGLDPAERWEGALDGGPYDPKVSEETYRVLGERARTVLAHGGSVIADANFGRRWQREAIARIAEEEDVLCLLVELRVPEEELRRRIEHRRRTEPASVSDADWEVYRYLKERFEPPEEWPEAELLVLDPAPAIELSGAILDQLLQLDRSRRDASS